MTNGEKIEHDPCETCGYAEGSPFCLQYCPYDAEKKKEQEPCEDTVSHNTVEQLKKYTHGKKNTDKVEISVLALNRIIKALSQEPSEDMTTAYLMGYYADKEPCDDAISREAVIALYDKYRPSLATHVSEFGDELKALPSVTVRQTGEWIEKYHEVFKYYCDKCGTGSDLRTNYCPNCGAKMVSRRKVRNK